MKRQWIQAGTQWDEHEKIETWMLGYGGEIARRTWALNRHLLRSTFCLLYSGMCIPTIRQSIVTSKSRAQITQWHGVIFQKNIDHNTSVCIPEKAQVNPGVSPAQIIINNALISLQADFSSFRIFPINNSVTFFILHKSFTYYNTANLGQRSIVSMKHRLSGDTWDLG